MVQIDEVEHSKRTRAVLVSTIKGFDSTLPSLTSQPFGMVIKVLDSAVDKKIANSALAGAII